MGSNPLELESPSWFQTGWKINGPETVVEYRARHCPDQAETLEAIYSTKYSEMCELAKYMTCGVPFLKWMRAGNAPSCPSGLPADMPTGWD